MFYFHHTKNGGTAAVAIIKTGRKQHTGKKEKETCEPDVCDPNLQCGDRENVRSREVGHGGVAVNNPVWKTFLRF